MIGFLLPQFLGLEVTLLQLLQLELYTTNIDIVKFLIGELGLEGIWEMPELWQSVGSADKDLVLGREAQKRDVKTRNWRVCQWRLQMIKDLSVLSSKIGFSFIILLKKTR